MVNRVYKPIKPIWTVYLDEPDLTNENAQDWPINYCRSYARQGVDES